MVTEKAYYSEKKNKWTSYLAYRRTHVQLSRIIRFVVVNLLLSRWYSYKWMSTYTGTRSPRVYNCFWLPIECLLFLFQFLPVILSFVILFFSSPRIFAALVWCPRPRLWGLRVSLRQTLFAVVSKQEHLTHADIVKTRS